MSKSEINVSIDDRTSLTQLAEAQARFIKSWEPSDSHYAEVFERELIYLLHLATREAVASIVKAYTD